MNCSPPGSSVHGILQQKYWSGLPFPPPADLPDPGTEPVSPASQVDSSPLSLWESPPHCVYRHNSLLCSGNLLCKSHPQREQEGEKVISCPVVGTLEISQCIMSKPQKNRLTKLVVHRWGRCHGFRVWEDRHAAAKPCFSPWPSSMIYNTLCLLSNSWPLKKPHYLISCEHHGFFTRVTWVVQGSSHRSLQW